MKSDMELAFRKLMDRERQKPVSKWPEGDIRRIITVVLWDRTEERKQQYATKGVTQ